MILRPYYLSNAGKFAISVGNQGAAAISPLGVVVTSHRQSGGVPIILRFIIIQDNYKIRALD